MCGQDNAGGLEFKDNAPRKFVNVSGNTDGADTLCAVCRQIIQASGEGVDSADVLLKPGHAGYAAAGRPA